MSVPVTFDSVSPRLALPLLFVGQAQKEDYVNEALLIIDGLVHCAIEAQQSAPPATPDDGQAWLIGSAATGAWSGHEDEIALRQLGQWLFVVPRDGMRILNKTTGQWLGRVSGAWHAPTTPAAPTGGSVIDVECRSALGQVIAALRSTGVLPA